MSDDNSLNPEMRPFSRRDWLRAGSLTPLGLNLPHLFAGRELSAESGDLVATPRVPTSFGRAKSCIVLFLFGAPAHQDLWDLKPDAPSQVRGEFKPIPTNVPGIIVGEHVPKLAQLMDRFALIRSVTHPDNTHTVAMHYMLTGVRHARPSTNPQNAPDDFPCLGSVLNYAVLNGGLSKRNRDSHVARHQAGLPLSVSLNAPANQVSANNHIFPGFFAGFIGQAYDPMFVSQNANIPDFHALPLVNDPDRLTLRHNLHLELQQFERIQHTNQAKRFESQFNKAFGMLTAASVRSAFRLSDVPEKDRIRYGMTPFGQGCLLARRLVEHGIPLVTVNWERDDAYWDTHKNNFSEMKGKLCPNLDQGLSSLLDDLDQRNLLNETLVVALGEFGRTPYVNSSAGRDHWAPCNSVLLAGAGIPGGTVYGSSDRLAAYPASDPVTPEDLAATIYHLLGIDSNLKLVDSQGRPFHLTTGEPIWKLL